MSSHLKIAVYRLRNAILATITTPLSDSGSSLVSASPYIVAAFVHENTVVHHGMPHKATSVAVYRLWITSDRFLSAGKGLTSFIRYSIPCKVLDNVRLWISGLFGRRWRNYRLICVRMQFSLTMSLRHSFISS